MISLFSCGPLVIALATWIGLRWVRVQQKPELAVIALSIVTANAVLAAWIHLYYRLHIPSASLAPWQDPQILDFGLLLLSAPIGMIVGGVAASRGTAKWLIWVLEGASIPLLVLGFFANAAI